jgi:hypothetical protein
MFQTHKNSVRVKKTWRRLLFGSAKGKINACFSIITPAPVPTCDCWCSGDVCGVDAAHNANLQKGHIINQTGSTKAPTCDCWCSQNVCGVDAAPNANLQDNYVRLCINEDAQTWQQQQQGQQQQGQGQGQGQWQQQQQQGQWQQ